MVVYCGLGRLGKDLEVTRGLLSTRLGSKPERER
jgi:hypothetical protein